MPLLLSKLSINLAYTLFPDLTPSSSVVTYKCTFALSVGRVHETPSGLHFKCFSTQRKMGQCSSRTSEQFNEFSSPITTKLSEKRTLGISQEKWRADASQNEAAAERRRRGCGTHGDCSGLVFVADPTGGVWIDETLGRQR